MQCGKHSDERRNIEYSGFDWWVMRCVDRHHNRSYHLNTTFSLEKGLPMRFCNIALTPGHRGQKRLWVGIVIRIESENLTKHSVVLRNCVTRVKM
jgi:hypothetical protein